MRKDTKTTTCLDSPIFSKTSNLARCQVTKTPQTNTLIKEYMLNLFASSVLSVMSQKQINYTEQNKLFHCEFMQSQKEL